MGKYKVYKGRSGIWHIALSEEDLIKSTDNSFVAYSKQEAEKKAKELNKELKGDNTEIPNKRHNALDEAQEHYLDSRMNSCLGDGLKEDIDRIIELAKNNFRKAAGSLKQSTKQQYGWREYEKEFNKRGEDKKYMFQDY